MNFKELISKRRACKLFNDKKINEKDLHFILEKGFAFYLRKRSLSPKLTWI